MPSAAPPTGQAPAFDRLPTRDEEKGHFLAVIEACRGSPNKLKFNPRLCAFELHSVLPLGQSFPYDFGFLPSTAGEDGDPLDVLVLMDDPVSAGVVVPCRIVGVIRATQVPANARAKARPVRNDRFIGVSTHSRRYGECQELADIAPRVLDEIADFFVAYNARKGVDFQPAKPRDAKRALALIEEGRLAFDKRHRPPRAAK